MTSPRIHLHAVLVAVFATHCCLGCDDLGPAPQVHRIVGNCGASPESGQIEAVVQGAGFEPRIRNDLGCGSQSLEAQDEFSLSVDGGSAHVALWVDHETLRSMIPASLEPGDHDIELKGPAGVRFEGRVPFLLECLPPETDSFSVNDTSSDPSTGTDSGTHTPADSVTTASDTNSFDTASQTEQTDTDSETQSADMQTSSDTQDTATERSCADLAGLDPHIACCPEPPPTDCSADSWLWDETSHDPAIGCCSGPQGPAVRCQFGSLVAESCIPGSLCVYVDGEQRHSCAHNSCLGPIFIDPSESPDGARWQGRFSDFEDTWQTDDSWNCNNTQYTDIWFEVAVPPGRTLRADATASLADVCVRWIESCASRNCLDAMDIIDSLDITNPGPDPSVHVTVVPSLANFLDDVDVTFTLLP